MPLAIQNVLMCRSTNWVAGVTSNLSSADYKDVMVNISFSSPESLGFFDGKEQYGIDAKSIVWTVGCMLLELLTAEPAFASRKVPHESYAHQLQDTLYRQWVRQCYLCHYPHLHVTACHELGLLC